jgi:hypothetical protein
MSLERKIEQNIQETQIKINKADIMLEQLEHDFSQLMQELNLTVEDAHQYIANPSNFTPEIWEELQNQKKQLDEKLQLELKNIKNPLKIKKSFSERGTIQPHWLFVR